MSNEPGISWSALVTGAVAFIASAIGIIYKENFFGFKDWVKKIGKVPKSDGDEAQPLGKTETQSTTVYLSTSSVRFDNERSVNRLDLQRAIHDLPVGGVGAYRVPLQYEQKLRLLQVKLDDLYSNYETRMGTQGSPDDFDRLDRVKCFSRTSLEELPITLGLLIARLKQEQRDLGDSEIGVICSRLVELRMVQIISGLAKSQLSSDEPLLTKYTTFRSSTPEYVAFIDGIGLEELVSYRIVFYGNANEQTIFAPREYGFKDLIVFNEFRSRGSGYVPPLTFMIDYSFPQMVYNNIEDPSWWNFDWHCQTVFVKDLNGNYIA